MKNLFFFFPFLVGLLPYYPADAAINPAIIPADARWIVYADLNALRAGALGQQLIALGVQAQVKTEQGSIGLDTAKVLATVGTVTAYGSNFSSDPNAIDGTLILQGTPELRKITESLLLSATLAEPKGFTEVTDLPFPAYAITPKGQKDGSKFELIVAFPPEPIVLVSKSRAQLTKARDVFRGTAPNLAKVAASPLKNLLKHSNNAYLFAASIVPSEKIFPDDQPQARILRMASSGALAIGENGPNTFAYAGLVASSEQMADKLMKILQGMSAMMSLAESNDKQLAEFLNSAAVARDGDTVTLNVSYASARIVQMIQNVQQQVSAEHPANRPVNRSAQMIIGKSIAEWQAEPTAAGEGSAPAPLASRTIENVELKNGTLITLGRQSNGGKSVRFDKVEISPVGASGAPLIFKAEYMKAAGNRGNMSQFQFPGADGSYNLKIAYVTDPEGKATYAVSLRDPHPTQPE